MKLEQVLDETNREIRNIEAHGEGVNLVKSVQALQHYLQTQSSFSMNLVKSLSQLEEDMGRNLYDLKYRRDSVSQDIKSIFSKIEKSRYSVFSIIIHEGTAESGHYYCFIKLNRDVWVKFNDFHTKQFTEEEVMKIAYGDKSNTASAYCVFYMKEDLFAKCPNHTYSISRKDGYYPLLNFEMARQMEIKNQGFIKVDSIYRDAHCWDVQEDCLHLFH